MNRNDFDEAVRRWREREERGSSLGVDELDELEDHLRARAVLEAELDGALGPGRAVMLAAERMGNAAALEREFAKAGKPRWRRWMGVGWGLWGVSWWLPAYIGTRPVPTFRDGGAVSYERVYPGYEAFGEALLGGGWLGGPHWTLSALTNILVATGLPILWRSRRRRRLRWLKWSIAGAAVLNLHWLTFGKALGIGYYAWLGSFVCLAVGLWLRDGTVRVREAGSPSRA